MPRKKRTEFARGYKLDLPAEERQRRAKQLELNGRPAFKINQEQAYQVKRLLGEGLPGCTVAIMTGLSKSTVSRIKNGKHISEIPNI